MSEFTQEDDDLLAELGVEVEKKKPKALSAKEERVITGFEEIQKFVEKHNRFPEHGEDKDIFERLYAVRLDRLRSLEKWRDLVSPLDHQNLLETPEGQATPDLDHMDDDALLEELGIEAQTADITELKHVRSSAEKRAAEMIANRTPCADFETFKPLFEQVQRELDAGARVSGVIRRDAGFLKTDIKEGEFFVLGGQTLYVAEVGDPFKAPNGEMDARLRVIYSNSTESNILLRSLQRALYKDDTSRRISDPNAGPLFADQADDEDLASGTVYVLRSKSKHALVEEHREVLHKIGVTGGKVERRLANAKLDPTFLMADVEVVATYELFNINRTKLEKLIHRFFEGTRLDIEIKDRFGNSVTPREWFLVPLFVIDQVVEKITDGSISDYRYDSENAELKRLMD